MTDTADAYAAARASHGGSHPIRVIVLGEPHRGDDGVAFVAVRQAMRDLAATVARPRRGPRDRSARPGRPRRAARRRGGDRRRRRPRRGRGRDRRHPARGPRDRGAHPARSSHVLPVEQLVGLAAALRGSPPPGVLVGIGGSDSRSASACRRPSPPPCLRWRTRSGTRSVGSPAADRCALRRARARPMSRQFGPAARSRQRAQGPFGMTDGTARPRPAGRTAPDVRDGRPSDARPIRTTLCT